MQANKHGSFIALQKFRKFRGGGRGGGTEVQNWSQIIYNLQHVVHTCLSPRNTYSTYYVQRAYFVYFCTASQRIIELDNMFMFEHDSKTLVETFFRVSGKYWLVSICII